MKVKRAPSICRRLVASLLWISMLAGLFTAVAVRYVIGHEVDELMDQELLETAEIIHSLLSSMSSDSAFISSATGDTEYETRLVWQLVDTRRGTVLSRSHRAPKQPLQTKMSPEPTDSLDRQWRYVTLGFTKMPDCLLVVAQSVREREEANASAIFYAMVISVLTGILSALLLNWQLRRELEPLAEFSKQVKYYDPLLPATLPNLATREELKPIEQAISELGQRLAQRIVSERAFTSHAAHALRTPVAGIDAQLAIALKEAPQSLRPRLVRAREATTRLSRVMQALLAMFRSGIDPQRQPTHLSELLSVLSFSELQVDLDSDLWLSVDPDLLAAALLNLLDNAQRHHAQRVQMVLTQDASWYHLRLHDDGEGCQPMHLQRLRLALARQDYSTDSGLKGLGLILADLVVRAHGGHIELPSVDKGFCVDLSWPIA